LQSKNVCLHNKKINAFYHISQKGERKNVSVISLDAFCNIEKNEKNLNPFLLQIAVRVFQVFFIVAFPALFILWAV